MLKQLRDIDPMTAMTVRVCALQAVIAVTSIAVIRTINSKPNARRPLI